MWVNHDWEDPALRYFGNQRAKTFYVTKLAGTKFKQSELFEIDGGHKDKAGWEVEVDPNPCKPAAVPLQSTLLRPMLNCH